jgi:hypothetical protein
MNSLLLSIEAFITRYPYPMPPDRFNHILFQADPELEAIRQRRMQELMAQRGGGGVRC